jgi:hypothetical protein
MTGVCKYTCGINRDVKSIENLYNVRNELNEERIPLLPFERQLPLWQLIRE